MDGDDQELTGVGGLEEQSLELDTSEPGIEGDVDTSSNDDLDKMTSLIDGDSEGLLSADSAEATLEPELAPSLDSSSDLSVDLDLEAVEPPTLVSAAAAPKSLNPLGGNVMSIKKIQGIKVQVQVMLGSISLSVSQLASLKEGELISLDSSIGDPIEILANGQLIARGEIVVIEDENPTFGVTLTEIVDADISA